VPLFISIYAFGLLGFIIHAYLLSPQERTKAKLIELFLLYQLIFSLGITSFFAFIGFTFMAEYIAQITNWPASPFEQQMANVNLAFAVLGILCIWYRKLFWSATIIGFSVWILCDAIQHIYEAVALGNLSEGNIGVPLITDIIIPIVLLIALQQYWKTMEKPVKKPAREKQYGIYSKS
jgi:hypothetical protein